MINKVVDREFSLNIFDHLGAEEYLLNSRIPFILYFWRSRDSVVIGKHQNPWGECNMEMVKKNEITLARRSSGGGTVFHDRGNLNFSIITHRKLFNPQGNLEVIKLILQRQGLKASIRDQYALFCEGKKISGSAFYLKKDRALHHGTLLIDTDLSRLKKALIPQIKILKDRSVPSRPAEVVNLRTLKEELTITKMKALMTEAFERKWGETFSRFPIKELELAASEFKTKYGDPGWLFGYPKAFRLNSNTLFDSIPADEVSSLDLAKKYFSIKQEVN